jgi:hypothetical protein
MEHAIEHKIVSALRDTEEFSADAMVTERQAEGLCDGLWAARQPA